MKVVFSVDVEQDCPPYLSTYSGIEQGMPVLLDLLSAAGIPATFFVTGDVARRFPAVVHRIVEAGHELGCHGDSHRSFARLSETEARREIGNASLTLRQFASVQSFRAPNLQLPDRFVPLLEQAGFTLDSSQAKYKWPFSPRPRQTGAITRIPASTTSSVLRLPRPIRERVLASLASPVVLFVHPWELVDLRHSRLRLDCRFRTGAMARQCILETIRFFETRDARFVPLLDLARPDAAPAARDTAER